ncbi:MAG: hypothetical protein ACD_79C01432G0002 [uncultured bacterium]|nr:MAG: hypothetical protein ACD_79C01432G0002 [uncultured bacterium]
MKKLLLILIFNLSLFSLYPDVLKLKNGDTVDGQIITINDKELILKIQYGTINYLLTDISEIIYDAQIQGDKLFNENKFIEALKFYQEVLIKNTYPDFQAQMYFKIAECQKQLNASDKAIEYFKKIINEFSNTKYVIKSYFAIAELQTEDEALKTYNTIIEKFPEDLQTAKAYHSVFDYYSKKNDIEKAKEYYELLIKRFPKYQGIKTIQKIIEDYEFNLNIPKKLEQIKSEIEKIQNMRWHYKNLKLYNPIINELEVIINNTLDINLIMQAYIFLIQCFNNQAEYKKLINYITINFHKLLNKNSSQFNFFVEFANKAFINKDYNLAAVCYNKINIEHYQLNTAISEIKSYLFSSQYEKSIESCLYYFYHYRDCETYLIDRELIFDCISRIINKEKFILNVDLKYIDFFLENLKKIKNEQLLSLSYFFIVRFYYQNNKNIEANKLVNLILEKYKLSEYWHYANIMQKQN